MSLSDLYRALGEIDRKLLIRQEPLHLKLKIYLETEIAKEKMSLSVAEQELKGIFSASEIQVINAGLRRLDEKQMILAALNQVDGFDEQKASIMQKLQTSK